MKSKYSGTVGNNNVLLKEKYPEIEYIFHLSSSFNNNVMFPRIPKKKIRMPLEKGIYKRICFAKSLHGALYAIPFNRLYDNLSVYVPEDINSVYIFDDYIVKYVPDAYESGEIWVRNRILPVKKIGVIKAEIEVNTKSRNNPYYKYKKIDENFEEYNAILKYGNKKYKDHFDVRNYESPDYLSMRYIDVKESVKFYILEDYYDILSKAILH